MSRELSSMCRRSVHNMCKTALANTGSGYKEGESLIPPMTRSIGRSRPSRIGNAQECVDRYLGRLHEHNRSMSEFITDGRILDTLRKYDSGMSMEDIAKGCEVTVSTVRKRLFGRKDSAYSVLRYWCNRL